MSEPIKGLTRGGKEWLPGFITALDESRCIGCGRCYKVCPREVFELVERDPDSVAVDDWDDDFAADDNTMVMRLQNPLDCIGCEACSRVCPKDCHSHAPQSVMAYQGGEKRLR